MYRRGRLAGERQARSGGGAAACAWRELAARAAVCAALCSAQRRGGALARAAAQRTARAAQQRQPVNLSPQQNARACRVRDSGMAAAQIGSAHLT